MVVLGVSVSTVLDGVIMALVCMGAWATSLGLVALVRLVLGVLGAKRTVPALVDAAAGASPMPSMGLYRTSTPPEPCEVVPVPVESPAPASTAAPPYVQLSPSSLSKLVDTMVEESRKLHDELVDTRHRLDSIARDLARASGRLVGVPMTDFTPGPRMKYLLVSVEDARWLVQAASGFAGTGPDGRDVLGRMRTDEGGDVEKIVRDLKGMGVCAPCVVEGQASHCEVLEAQALGRRLDRLLERAEPGGRGHRLPIKEDT